LYGKRKEKYAFLTNNALAIVPYKEVKSSAPDFSFKYADEALAKKYSEGLNSVELFTINVMGFQTHRDSFAIGSTVNEIQRRAQTLIDTSVSSDEIISEFQI